MFIFKYPTTKQSQISCVNKYLRETVRRSKSLGMTVDLKLRKKVVKYQRNI